MGFREFVGQVLFGERGPFRQKSSFENAAETWYQEFWGAVLWNSFGVKVFTFMAVLLGHDESGPMLGVKLLVGPRWREFHCLAASRGLL